jgi:adenylate kinase family enzyme
MTRVAVIGNAGGGKSTLCKQLSSARRLPYFAIDKIQWRPGWRPVSDDEFALAHAAMLGRQSWIIDGFGPWEEIEKRFDLADTSSSWTIRSGFTIGGRPRGKLHRFSEPGRTVRRAAPCSPSHSDFTA